jgi:hypothetical protein
MVDSIAVSRAMRASFELMWRPVMAAVLAGQFGTLFDYLEIPYSWSTPALISEVAAAPMGGTCPARSFSAFIDAFAESAAIQGRYTRIPLAYGHLDATLLGTPKEDNAFSTRTINSFEAIPSFDRTDKGRIFPSKKKRVEEGVEITIGAEKEHSGTGMIAAIVLPDAGLRVEYRFVKTNNCWYLVEIDDWST